MTFISINASPDLLILEHGFSWNTLADVDCRKKDHKRRRRSALQEEYYKYFPKK